MKYKYLLFISFSLILLLTTCQKNTLQKVHFVGQAQGTYYAITYFEMDGIDYQVEIDSILIAFDQSVSVYQTNSIVSKVNRNEKVTLDHWFIDNFRLSQKISNETNGCFDITIAPIANVWGFGTWEQPDSINHQLIDSLKQYVDFQKIKIENGKIVKENPHIQLNYNAVAQGYAVDVLSDFLLQKGIQHFLIDIGGEIYAKGQKPNGDAWKVGIEIPEDHAENRSYNSIVSIQDESVVTSGNYRKYYEIDGVKYAHSLDPKTGYPVKHSILSATVIAPKAADADAYATAFMVMGVDKTLSFVNADPRLHVFLMYDDHGIVKTVMSEGFEKYIETNNE